MARQRVQRGWSDHDLWSLDSYLAEILSTALPALADRTWGWPAILVEKEDGTIEDDPSFPFEDWQKELREAGERFARMVNDYWIDQLPDDQTQWTPEVLKSHFEAEHADRKAALAWLEKRFDALWI